ncbi:MAG: BMP family ABC transporter substrate-binding protein, partial [Lachnospiraceae bacterium]|nr:BMP family ABC transporter substrate-binding protein [Lachnospiraceae bacterium]
MKKVLSLVLALCLVLSLAGCSKSGDSGNKDSYKVAMITDYGDITDQSFNQTTYEACKAFCDANKVTFTYKRPSGDSTGERVTAVESAIDEGYNVIVMPGYAFGGTIVEVSEKYKDVKFVALDVSAGD